MAKKGASKSTISINLQLIEHLLNYLSANTDIDQAQQIAIAAANANNSAGSGNSISSSDSTDDVNSTQALISNEPCQLGSDYENGDLLYTDYKKEELTLVQVLERQKAQVALIDNQAKNFWEDDLVGYNRSSAKKDTVAEAESNQLMGTEEESVQLAQTKTDNSELWKVNQRKGNYGEMLTDIYMHQNGYIPIHKKPVTALIEPMERGIDGIYVKTSGKYEIWIIESKYNYAVLNMDTDDGPQMGLKWINNRLESILKDKSSDSTSEQNEKECAEKIRNSPLVFSAVARVYGSDLRVTKLEDVKKINLL